MNLNAGLSFKIDIKTLLPMLKGAQTYLYGVVLIGVFAYTAYTVNAALNVQPSLEQSTITPLPKITFDKPTITSLHTLDVVGGDVPLNGLGKNDPFTLK